MDVINQQKEHKITPAVSLYTRQGQRKYLSAVERLRFIESSLQENTPIRLFCLVLVLTGCRISEALALVGERVLLDEGVIVFLSLKKRRSGITRRVPAPLWLLEDLVAFSNAERLWPWGRTKAWQIVRNVLSKSGVATDQAMPKVLRHTFGVHAIQSGVPVHLVQRWLGHARLETTMIYMDVIGEEERTFARRMWKTVPTA